MGVIANIFAAGAFVYAGVLMVSSMAKSVKGIFSPQEIESDEQQEKTVYRVVKVRVKPKRSEK